MVYSHVDTWYYDVVSSVFLFEQCNTVNSTCIRPLKYSSLQIIITFDTGNSYEENKYKMTMTFDVYSTDVLCSYVNS